MKSILMKSRLFWESCNKRGNLKQLSEPNRGILRKFFNWLIENRMFQMPNPITKNTLVRKSSGLVRDHLPSNLEIQRLLSQDSEILPLIKFLIFTGARLDEVLHLEWDDIEDGVWMIKSKPNCMTK